MNEEGMGEKRTYLLLYKLANDMIMQEDHLIIIC